MNDQGQTVSCRAPECLYRVVARRPPDQVQEEYFQSRLKAERLMELLAEQGFAVMLSQKKVG